MKGLYLIAGYPDFETFSRAVEIAEAAGFDFIEVGIPFSDPVADGPFLTKAAQEAIKKGVSFERALDWMRSYKGSLKLYVMTYANVLWAMGLEKASKELEKVGVEGVIVADLPNSEHGFFKSNGFSLPLISFATPESRRKDIKELEKVNEGFIYFVSVRGTTGGRFNPDEETKEKILHLKNHCKVPVVLGFGISTKEDAEEALKLAHGFVIGTEAVRRLSSGIKDFESWCFEIGKV